MLRHLIAMILGTLLLLGAVGFAWPADARPADGTLTVDNQRFGQVVLTLDGRQLGDIPPESHRDFRVPAGEHALRVRTKDGTPVLAQTVRVRPHSAVQVMVVPDEGKLTVRNETGRDGRLLVNSLDRGGLAPGQARVLMLEPGTVSIRIQQADRVLDSARISLRAGERKTWSAVAPTVAELQLRNPLPVPVKVRVDGDAVMRLEPGESRLVRSVRVGQVPVVVTELDGRVMSQERVEVDPFDGGLFSVPLPAEGPVRVVNLGAGDVEVYADGRRVATVRARGEQVVMIPIGATELTLRDRSRNIVLRTEVELEPFEELSLRIDLPRHFVSQERALVAELEALIEALRRLAS